MAFEAYDDHEQSERVQQWLRDNATAIVAGIVLGLLLIFGLNQWRAHRAKHRAEAATLYQQLGQATKANDKAKVTAITGELEDKYKNTAFSVFAAFADAKRAMAANKPADAIKALTWAKAHAGDKALQALATVRIATVQIASGKAQAALATLNGLTAGEFKGMVYELRGDALAALNRDAEARTAYNEALTAFADDAPQKPLLQLKLDNLAATGAGA